MLSERTIHNEKESKLSFDTEECASIKRSFPERGHHEERGKRTNDENKSRDLVGGRRWRQKAGE